MVCRAGHDERLSARMQGNVPKSRRLAQRASLALSVPAPEQAPEPRGSRPVQLTVAFSLVSEAVGVTGLEPVTSAV